MHYIIRVKVRFNLQIYCHWKVRTCTRSTGIAVEMDHGSWVVASRYTHLRNAEERNTIPFRASGSDEVIMMAGMRMPNHP